MSHTKRSALLSILDKDFNSKALFQQIWAVQIMIEDIGEKTFTNMQIQARRDVGKKYVGGIVR